MTFKLIINSFLINFVLTTNIYAESTYSCSTDSKGKAVVIDSAKPGSSIPVAKIKSKLAKAKEKLKSQKSSIKSNKKLSKEAKATKLAELKIKEDANKADSALVKTCKNGAASPPGPTSAPVVIDAAAANDGATIVVIAELPLASVGAGVKYCFKGQRSDGTPIDWKSTFISDPCGAIPYTYGSCKRADGYVGATLREYSNGTYVGEELEKAKAEFIADWPKTVTMERSGTGSCP